jgi:hypothetical protein
MKKKGSILLAISLLQNITLLLPTFILNHEQLENVTEKLLKDDPLLPIDGRNLLTPHCDTFNSDNLLKYLKIGIEAYHKGTNLELDWCACQRMPVKRRIAWALSLMLEAQQKGFKEDEPLTYTSFACGTGLLQDYVNLTLLKLIGCSPTAFILIDPKFTGSVDSEKNVQILLKFLRPRSLLSRTPCYTGTDEYLQDPKAPLTDILTATDLGEQYPALVHYIKIKKTYLSPNGLAHTHHLKELEELED